MYVTHNPEPGFLKQVLCRGVIIDHSQDKSEEGPFVSLDNFVNRPWIAFPDQVDQLVLFHQLPCSIITAS